MATLTITVPVGGYAGSTFRALARAIEEVASNVPDQNATGASVVLSIVSPSATTGLASVALTAGPYTSTTQIVG